jgi:hemoglobin/transferrin/lactoferrin receptor protein
MSRHLLPLVAVCLVLAAGGVAAQNALPPEAGLAVADDEPTLPPVVVRPDPEPVTEAAPPPPPPPPPAPRYPSLSQQAFGAGDGVGLDSIVRGEKSLFDLPAFGTIVDRQTLAERQADDIFRALQEEVGVVMQRTAAGHASPFIRGLTGQQVLMLVDGIRINNPIMRAGPNPYFNLIDPGQIERIEVIRGPQSVLWGSDAIGGAINVVTRSASTDRGDYGGASFRQYFSTADAASYSRANVEGWVGRAGVFSGASYLNVNDLRRGGSLGVQPFTSYDQYAGDLKLNYLLGGDAMLTLAFQHFEQENVPRSDRFPPFVFGPPAGTPRPSWVDPQQRDLVYLRCQGLAYHGLFDAYSATFSFSRNKEGSREVRSPTRTDLGELDVLTFGFTLALARDLDWLGRLTYGTDYYHDHVGAVRHRFNPQTGAMTPVNPQIPDGARYQAVGVFLNWDVDVTERLGATAGVRYQNNDAMGTLEQVVGTPAPFTRNYNDWIASVGLLHKTTEHVRFFGNVSEGFRAPNLTDLAVSRTAWQDREEIPGLDVQPEHARTYEVGVKVETPRLRFQLSEYWTDLRDNILRQAVDADGNPVPSVIGPYGTVIPGSSDFVRGNFDSYLNGTELAGEYLLRDNWWAYGNFWYTYGRNMVTGEPLGRIPPAQGILGLRWRDAGNRRWFQCYAWMANRQTRFAPENNIDARYPVGGLPPFVTLNLRMGTTWGCRQKHVLSASLENITNTPYRVVGSGVDGPGFNAIFGYEWIH